MSNRARHWLAQAERDLERAGDSFRARRFEWACSAAQKVTEKAVKGIHLHRGQEAWGQVAVRLLEDEEKRRRSAETTTSPDAARGQTRIRGNIPRLVLALLVLSVHSVQAEPLPLRLATWNLEHLAADGRDGCRPRTEADYARLRHHADRLEADIIALQEVENAAAVARVFDPGVYDIEISRRPDRYPGRCRRQPKQMRTMQRTGFAIDRARLAALGMTYRRLPDFKAVGLETQRWATRLLLEPAARAGESVELMSLHLKSGCFYGRLDGSLDRHQCDTLIRQRGILEEWIDARGSNDQRFVLLGDFNRQLDQPGDGFWADIDDGIVCEWEPDPALGRKCRPGTRQPHPGADMVLANAGTPFPFPFNPRYPYAVDHLAFDAVTAELVMAESYLALDYEDDDPAPSDHHPVAISLRLTGRAQSDGRRSDFLRWLDDWRD